MNSKIKKWTALICSAAMLTAGLPGVSLAAPGPQVLAAGTDFPADLARLKVPETLGTIEEAFLTGGKQTVILIQDAHAVPDAQNNIRKLISYLQSETGAGAVAVEGAAGTLDTFFLRKFPDAARLKKTMREYHHRAELSGTSAAALFDSGPTMYYGVEDWPLYEEGIRLYQEALKQSDKVHLRVKKERSELESLKAKTYSSKLLAFDKSLRRYQVQGEDLAETLRLAGTLYPAEEGSALAALIQQVQSADTSEEMLRREAKQALAMFWEQQGFSHSPLPAAFNSAIQSFETGEMSAVSFALILKQGAKKQKVTLAFEPELRRQMRMQKKLNAIKGTNLYEDLENYLRKAKESLVTTAEEKELDQRSRKLDLFEKLSRLELTRQEWEELKSSKRNISAAKETQPAAVLFYLNAEKREEAFLIGLRKIAEKPQKPFNAKLLGRSEGKSSAVIFVAGGFHSQGLTLRLREKNIRYLLLSPKIKTLPKESKYSAQMKGEVSWKNYFRIQNGKVNLRDAFLRAVRDDLLVSGGLPGENEVSAQRFLLKQWRDELIRGLADERRLDEAGDYTRFIDELVLGRETEGKGNDGKFQDVLLPERLRRFIDGLSQLEQTKQVTEQNVFKLLRANINEPVLSAQPSAEVGAAKAHTAQVPAVGGQFAAGAELNAAALGLGERELFSKPTLKTRPGARSEVRPIIENGKLTIEAPEGFLEAMRRDALRFKLDHAGLWMVPANPEAAPSGEKAQLNYANHGNFADVYVYPGYHGAVKIMREESAADQEHVLHELNVLRQLSEHFSDLIKQKRLPQIIAKGKTSGRVYLLMDAPKNALDLETVRENQAVKFGRRVDILKSAAGTLEALNQGGWLHNDVKLPNIIVGDEGAGPVQIIDFGMSQRLKDAGERDQKKDLERFSSLAVSFLVHTHDAPVSRDQIRAILRLQTWTAVGDFLDDLKMRSEVRVKTGEDVAETPSPAGLFQTRTAWQEWGVRLGLPAAALGLGLLSTFLTKEIENHAFSTLTMRSLQFGLGSLTAVGMVSTANFMGQWRTPGIQPSWKRALRFAAIIQVAFLFWFFMKPFLRIYLDESGPVAMVAVDTLLSLVLSRLMSYLIFKAEKQPPEEIRRNMREKFWLGYGLNSAIWGMFNMAIYSIPQSWAWTIPIASDTVGFLMGVTFAGYLYRESVRGRMPDLWRSLGVMTPAVSGGAAGYFLLAPLAGALGGVLAGAALGMLWSILVARPYVMQVFEKKAPQTVSVNKSPEMKRSEMRSAAEDPFAEYRFSVPQNFNWVSVSIPRNQVRQYIPQLSIAIKALKKHGIDVRAFGGAIRALAFATRFQFPLPISELDFAVPFEVLMGDQFEQYEAALKDYETQLTAQRRRVRYELDPYIWHPTDEKSFEVILNQKEWSLSKFWAEFDEQRQAFVLWGDQQWFEDVEQKRLRITGEEKFSDPERLPRMLKLARQLQRFGFEVEPESLQLFDAEVQQDAYISGNYKKIRQQVLELLEEIRNEQLVRHPEKDAETSKRLLEQNRQRQSELLAWALALSPQADRDKLKLVLEKHLEARQDSFAEAVFSHEDEGGRYIVYLHQSQPWALKAPKRFSIQGDLEEDITEAEREGGELFAPFFTLDASEAEQLRHLLQEDLAVDYEREWIVQQAAHSLYSIVGELLTAWGKSEDSQSREEIKASLKILFTEWKRLVYRSWALGFVMSDYSLESAGLMQGGQIRFTGESFDDDWARFYIGAESSAELVNNANRQWLQTMLGSEELVEQVYGDGLRTADFGLLWPVDSEIEEEEKPAAYQKRSPLFETAEAKQTFISKFQQDVGIQFQRSEIRGQAAADITLTESELRRLTRQAAAALDIPEQNFKRAELQVAGTRGAPAQTVEVEYASGQKTGAVQRVGPLIFVQYLKEEDLQGLREKIGMNSPNILFYPPMDMKWARHRPSPHPEAVALDKPFLTGHTSVLAALTMTDGGLNRWKGRVAADFYAGKGIMGLIALRLGAKKVYVVESDPELLQKAKEVFRVNGYSTIPAEGSVSQVVFVSKAVTSQSRPEQILPAAALNEIQDLIAHAGSAYADLDLWVYRYFQGASDIENLFMGGYGGGQADQPGFMTRSSVSSSGHVKASLMTPTHLLSGEVPFFEYTHAHRLTKPAGRSEVRAGVIDELDLAPQYRKIVEGFRKAQVPEETIRKMEKEISEIVMHQPPFVLRQGKPLLNLFRIFDPALDGRVAEFVSTTGAVYALLSEAFSKKAKDFYDHDNLTALYFASQIVDLKEEDGQPRYDLLSIGHKIKSEEAGGAVPDAILYDRQQEMYLIGEFRAGQGNFTKLLQQKRQQTLAYLRLLLNADLRAFVGSDETILPQSVIGLNPSGLVWAVDKSFIKGDQAEAWSVAAETRNKLREFVAEAKRKLRRDGLPIRNDFDLDHVSIEFLDQTTLYKGPGTTPEVKNGLAIAPEDWQKAASVLDGFYDQPGFSGFSGLMNAELYGLAKKLNWQRADGAELSLEEIYYRYFALGSTIEERLAEINRLTDTARSEMRAEHNLSAQFGSEAENIRRFLDWEDLALDSEVYVTSTRKSERGSRARYVSEHKEQSGRVFYSARYESVKESSEDLASVLQREERIQNLAAQTGVSSRAKIFETQAGPVVIQHAWPGRSITGLRDEDEIKALGRALGLLHRQGIRHGDLIYGRGYIRENNILLNKTRKDEPLIGFIDFEFSKMNESPDALAGEKRQVRFALHRFYGISEDFLRAFDEAYEQALDGIEGSRSEVRRERSFLRQGPLSREVFDTQRSTFERQEVPLELRERLIEILAEEGRSYYLDETKSRLLNVIEKLRNEDFKIFSIPPQRLGPSDYLEGFYDEKQNKLYVSEDYLRVLGGESERQSDPGQILEDYRVMLEGRDPEAKDYPRRLLHELMFPPRKVLVLGASGFLGKEIYDKLSRVYPDVTGTTHTQKREVDFIPLDVTREADVWALIEQEKPDVIIYAAGIADVQTAENEKERTLSLNAAVPERLAKQFGGQLIYLSTDYVFDGQNFPYETSAPTQPVNFYGQTKAQGEQAVLAFPQNAVVRFGLVFGAQDPVRRDAVQQFILHMEGFTQGDEPLVLNDTQVRHPIWASDIADLVTEAVRDQRQGILQINGTESMTQFQFAKAVEEAYREAVEWHGMRAAVPEGPFWVPAKDTPPQAAVIARPPNAQMVNTAEPRPFYEALKNMVFRYEDLTQKFFYEALLAGDSQTFHELAETLEKKGIRWAITGNAEKLSAWPSDKPRVYSYDERAQIHEVLKAGFDMTAPSRIRIDRVIDAGILNTPASEIQILFTRQFPHPGYKEPYFELNAVSKSHNANVLNYLLLHGYSENMNAGMGARKVWVPLQEDGGRGSYREQLQGGSLSSVSRIYLPDGRSLIEKRAHTAEDEGKLLAEARYMQQLQEDSDSAGRWFPEILSIREAEGETIVEMEDIPWPNLTDVVQQSFAEKAYDFFPGASSRVVSKKTQMQVLQDIYRLLTPAFYSQVQNPTPPDFIERYHFKKVEERWQKAAQKSEFVRRLLEAPYLEFSEEGQPLMPNLKLMLNVLRRIASAHPEPFTPPYLSKQHGDLHEGNILVDPFSFMATGQIENIKLIDPKYIPEGNDPLYDFAKLIHNYFGHYDLALDHSAAFHFNIRLPQAENKPAVFSSYFDDDAIGTAMMLSRIDMFNKEFISFLQGFEGDRLFSFEKDPIAWRMRLLFTHATLIAGLFHFHARGDQHEAKVGILYERSAHLFHMLLDGFYAQGLMKDIPGLHGAWKAQSKARAQNKRAKFEKALQRIEKALGQTKSRSEVRTRESPVADILREQIRNKGGAITFRDFMETALYEPSHGYYTSGKVSLGGHDAFHDFSTYAESNTEAFAEGLLNHMREMWEQLGQPKNLQIVEMGAGQGVLAANILQMAKTALAQLASAGPLSGEGKKLQRFLKALDYVIVEISEDLKKRQQTAIARVLTEPSVSDDQISDAQVRVRWAPFAAHQITGMETAEKKNPLKVSMPRIFVSNELPDAFPVHRVKARVAESGLLDYLEAFVTVDASGQFIETWKPLESKNALRIEMAIQAMGQVYENRLRAGGEVAVNLQALEWQGRMADLLSRSPKDRGYIITMDYGYPGKQYIPDNEMSVRSYAKERPFVFLGIKIRNPSLIQTIHLAMGMMDHLIRLFPLSLKRLLYRINPMNLFKPDDHYIYEKPGYTDITADVDFSMLDHLGERLGLATEALVPQGYFFELAGLSRAKAARLDHPGFFAIVQSQGIKTALFENQRAVPSIKDVLERGARRSEVRSSTVETKIVNETWTKEQVVSAFSAFVAEGKVRFDGSIVPIAFDDPEQPEGKPYLDYGLSEEEMNSGWFQNLHKLRGDAFWQSVAERSFSQGPLPASWDEIPVVETLLDPLILQLPTEMQGSNSVFYYSRMQNEHGEAFPVLIKTASGRALAAEDLAEEALAGLLLKRFGFSTMLGVVNLKQAPSGEFQKGIVYKIIPALGLEEDYTLMPRRIVAAQFDWFPEMLKTRFGAAFYDLGNSVSQHGGQIALQKAIEAFNKAYEVQRKTREARSEERQVPKTPASADTSVSARSEVRESSLRSVQEYEFNRLRQEIFGSKVEVWLARHRRNGKKSERQRVIQDLVERKDFLEFLETDREWFEILRWLIDQEIILNTKSLDLFSQELKKELPKEMARKMGVPKLPLSEYTRLLTLLKTPEMQSYLNDAEFKKTPREDRLGALVEKILDLGLVLESENLGHIYTALPAHLSEGVAKIDVQMVKLPMRVYLQVREALKHPEVISFLNHEDYMDSEKTPREDRLGTLVDTILDLGLALESDNLGQIYTALPARLSERVAKIDVQMVKLPMRVYLQVREALKHPEVISFLNHEDYMDSEKTAREDRLGSLVEKILDLGLVLESENLGQIYSTLPARLSAKVTKKDIQKVELPMRVYLQVREALKHPEVISFLNHEDYMDSEKTPREDRLGTLVDTILDLGLALESDNLGQIYTALPARLSERVRKKDVQNVQLPMRVYLQVREALKHPEVISFLNQEDYMDGEKTPREDRLGSLVDKILDLGLVLEGDNLGQIYTAVPARLSEKVTKKDIQIVILPMRVYLQVREALKHPEVISFLNQEDYMDDEKTPREDRLGALVEKILDLGLVLESENLGHIYTALPAGLSERVRKKDIQNVQLPMRVYLQVREAVKDPEVISFLNQADYMDSTKMSREDRLGALVGKILDLGLALESENLGHIYTALPARLSERVRKKDIQNVQLPMRVYLQVREAVKDPEVISFLNQKDYMDGGKTPREDRLGTLVGKILDLGLALESENLGHIYTALPARLSERVRKKDIQNVQLPMRVYLQVRKALKHPEVISFLNQEDYMDDEKTPREDRLGALVEKILDLGLVLESENLGHIYTALPARLSEKVSKEDIQSVSLPLSVYQERRSRRSEERQVPKTPASADTSVSARSEERQVPKMPASADTSVSARFEVRTTKLFQENAAMAARGLVDALETREISRSEVRQAVALTVEVGGGPVVAELKRILNELTARAARGETILIAGQRVDAALVQTQVQSMMEVLTAKLTADVSTGHVVTYLVPEDEAGAVTLSRVLERFFSRVDQVLLKKEPGQRIAPVFLDRMKELGLPVSFVSSLAKAPAVRTDQVYLGLVGPDTGLPQQGLAEEFVPVVETQGESASTDPLIRELELALQTAIALLVAEKIRKVSDKGTLHAQAVALLKDYELFAGFESRVILPREGGISISGAAIESFLAEWAARQKVEMAA